jgi:dCMP deaminase
MFGEKWDRRFLDLARHISTWSKDKSTQCGAVIVRPDKTVASVGYNGFAKGIADTDERLDNRELKYELIIHCEENAILNAAERVRGYTLFVFPFLTCSRCAVRVIQSGIRRVVAPICPPDKAERWEESFARARALYAEAGVEFSEIER